MPRPCAVESHARHYKHTPHKNFPDATALRRGVSRSPLQKQPLQKSLRCHGLAPWSLMLAATKTTPAKNLSDATALRRGVSRSPLQKQTPRKNLSDATARSPLQKQTPQKFPRCHGARSPLQKQTLAKISQMPRHARRYQSLLEPSLV